MGVTIRSEESVAQIGDSSFARRLRKEIEGEVHVDAFTRGRYSTDASIYQINPVAVAIPRSEQDLLRIVDIARDAKIPLLMRGGGTSQCGQTVGEALVVDTSKYLNKCLDLDPANHSVTVQPGLVLDQLNALLKPHKMFFPVDPSTASRATIGGMAGNNSCGGRSIRYGMMEHNVSAIEAILADGTQARFAELPEDLAGMSGPSRYKDLVGKVHEIVARESDEIDARIPKLLRVVGGYNIDSVHQGHRNMARFLVGSEGTLAISKSLTLIAHDIPPHRVVGVCHFPSFYEAMKTTPSIVALDPTSCEVVDRTMIELARGHATFAPLIAKFMRGEPDALLLVEFSGETQDEPLRRLKQLHEVMADCGYPGAVLDAVAPALQNDITFVRQAAFNIMMSMKGDGKPVSFIEDCAVHLEDLADYTARLTGIFDKYGVKGTWYAHASVGCLHVRPILNMKSPDDVRKMRAIAEETFEIVREYKGSHSGEHGDGIVRSEFHEPMFGPKIVAAFEEIKDAFDPESLFNPGKIVRAPKMDDRRLFRYKPDYAVAPVDTAFDWSDWGGIGGAIEMCNNNGACRKNDAEVMCPSYRVTRDEQHVTRGRANTLRLALSGQLGPEAMASDDMAATMDLCVSCKACKRECPTGVDMARFKIEFLHQYRKRRTLTAGERLIAYLPRYAPFAQRLRRILNRRNGSALLSRLGEKLLALSARRPLPRWHDRPYLSTDLPGGGGGATRQVALFVDTFSTWFEPETARAAESVLRAAGYDVHLLKPDGGGRPLCCGRTFLASGLVEEARLEARRVAEALAPFAARGIPVVGLEPSCVLGLRDEIPALLGADILVPKVLMFEEFLIEEKAQGRLDLVLDARPDGKVLLHGHCHQKAFKAMSAVEQALRLVLGLEVKTVSSSCCGMAGSFGYEARHFDTSLAMAELDLLPAVRKADQDVTIVADGTSCRGQIRDGAHREAVHVAVFLASALMDLP
jgi:FAD/FMN-containing dehydrogenase/Fe-S oxidoreductase